MSWGTVYIIDDDEAIRDALSWLLKSRNITSVTFPSAEAFLAQYQSSFSGCLIIDIRMEGISGLELFTTLQSRHCSLPIIFLTGHGDISLAVNALRSGAFNFIEKPFNDNKLVDCVIEALEFEEQQRTKRKAAGSLEERLASLTPREREVMNRILEGKFNKIIADELNIAMRTVEVHRSRIFDKLKVKTAVELAQLISNK